MDIAEIDSSDYSEDDSAVLLTEKVEDNIFKTLLKIKNKDPDIYNNEHVFFNDSDFDAAEDNDSNKKEKPYTYGDMLRETLIAEGSDFLQKDESSFEKQTSYNDEQEMLKKEFLAASKDLDSDDDFFVKSNDANIPEIQPLPASKERQLNIREHDLISKFWSSEKLDENEEFLKDYILNQRWREDRIDNFTYLDSSKQLDMVDEEYLEKAEEFEHKYNYRFEEEDGSKIITYPRNIEDSLRKVDTRRRDKRLERKQRRLEAKIQKDEEIKRLKNIDKLRRLQDIGDMAGVKLDENIIDLDAPFNPEQHERDMKRILGIGYDRDEKDDYGSEEDPELWWLCDHCNKGIQVGHMHFDCKICENYTLCNSCLDIANHEHKDMTPKKVPLICAPPDDDSETADCYRFDYEDIVGDMPVRFKYRKVDPINCDIRTVLEKTDKELNSIMPLHKLIAYDVPGVTERWHKKTRENAVKKSKFSRIDRRMTKYNVNRDRLEAFGLSYNQKPKKKLKT
ncbi:hypothetical protein BEWA_008100 [Theileria equi strain WA]|uniref:Kri1-like C-terminal domain-containing protein n=1 Tax=Theileria equi strain WA TaxID=1537102 RepID=L0B0S4_THEEQ|nr:hypothetical protein BEWA_008100 [Theileria equi strain WA]AFZ81400.1 hypothetical protein BEWA_008100 [Theileria equi strain WA]|eukprot:XP_004831066.1 hypothetical protein BEWA_008100 [Theileria equi strain WA]